MNLLNFWKDFNSNFDRQGLRARIGPLLPLIPQVGHDLVNALTSYWLSKTRPYRLSELGRDHLVIKYGPTPASMREFLSQSMYFVMEAWEKFLNFQKKQNPQLEKLEFVLEQVETELFEMRPKKLAEPAEYQLKLHWPFAELELMRAKLESQGEVESPSRVTLNDQLPVQIFSGDGLKLAHFSLHYRVSFLPQGQLTRNL
jgi:hypothetical protein